VRRSRTVGSAVTALALVATGLSGCAVGFGGPALDVTYNGARLTGTVFSNRSEAGNWWFRYGLTSSYGTESPHRPIAFQANVGQGVSEVISGLEPTRTYHYALCAEDQDPEVDALCSSDRTFTTPGDYVRGRLLVVGDMDFNDVRSGPGGESPAGSVTYNGITASVTCLQVSGQKFTLGLGSGVRIFVHVEPGTAAFESMGSTPETDCPATLGSGATVYPAFPYSDFIIHDDP
jgi:hypothetical protein